jgi:endoglucanase
MATAIRILPVGRVGSTVSIGINGVVRPFAVNQVITVDDEALQIIQSAGLSYTSGADLLLPTPPPSPEIAAAVARVQEISDRVDVALSGAGQVGGIAPKAVLPTGLRGIHLVGSDRSVNASTWPTRIGMDYFIARGFNLFRFGTKWNCLQKAGPSGSPFGQPLDANNLAQMIDAIGYVTGRGAWAIIDIHDYLLYDTTQADADQSVRAIVGQDARVSNAIFAAFWKLIADRFKNNSHVIFELQNEPGGVQQPTGGAGAWAATAQACINAIRATGALNPILIDNYAATDWNLNGNAEAMSSLVDPAKNLVFAPHVYMDGSGGTQQSCIVGDAVFHLTQYVKWARATGNIGILGETGAGNNATCYRATRELLDFVEGNPDVFRGWLWFGAYAGQGTYQVPDNFFLGIDPDTYDPSYATDDGRVSGPLLPFLSNSRGAVVSTSVTPAAMSAAGGTATVVADPNGIPNNATKLVESTSTGNHLLVTSPMATASGKKYILTFDAKRGVGTRDLVAGFQLFSSYDSCAVAISLDSAKAVGIPNNYGGLRLTRPTVDVRQLDKQTVRISVGTILFVSDASATNIQGVINMIPNGGVDAPGNVGDGASSVIVWNVKLKVQ